MNGGIFNMKRFFVPLLLLILVGCSDTNIENARMLQVLDGDTIKVNLNGEHEIVRLLLIDAPETDHPDPIQPFGLEASEFARDTLKRGRTVQVEIDESERDKYGRLLAYIWIDGKMFNEMLLEKGFAKVAYINPPNVKYVDQFNEIQEKAIQEGLGIWSIENYVQEEKNEDMEIDRFTNIEIVEVNLKEEYIKLKNNSKDAVYPMTNSTIISFESNQVFEFPEGYDLYPSDTVTIWSGRNAKNNPPTDLLWTTNNIWNDDGDTAILKVYDEYKYAGYIEDVYQAN